MSVVGTPFRAKTWASSTPVAPAPRIARLAGSVWAVVASRLVQASIASSPSMCGIVGTDPTAITMNFASRARGGPSDVTETRPAPSRRPVPRTSVAPDRSRSLTWPASFGRPASSRSMTSSRHRDAAAQSKSPPLAWIAAAWRSALEGMHDQNGHSPPTSSRSITATDAPRARARLAAASPADPAPMITKSNWSSMA